MAKIIGTAGTAPAARKVNRTPTRKTVPISRVPGIGQRRNYVAPKPHPAPRVIRDSGVANNAPVRRRPAPSPAIIKASRQFGIGLSPAQTMAQQHRIHRNAQARSAHLAARMDVLHSLGLGPARTIRSVGFGQSPTMLIGDQRRGATLRDSGVANNPAPSYHGQSISPQAIQRAMHAILQRGHSLQSQDAIGLLHAAGVSDPFGSTTPREVAHQQAQVRHYRNALIKHVTQMQLDWQSTGGRGGLGLSPMEIEAKLRGLPIRELERLTHWTPSTGDIVSSQVQTAGFSPKGLAQIETALGTALSSGARGVGNLTGSKTFGNALGDIASYPTWAIPAGYEAVTRPGAFAKGLTQGVIGHVARGDIKGAERAFQSHPLFSLAELRGAVALTGRLGAAAVRQGTGGRVLGTQRAPLNLTGLAGGVAKERSYSKSPYVQAVQRAGDKYLTREGMPVRRKTAIGEVMVPARVVKRELPVIGRALDARRAHSLNRFADYGASRTNSAERITREHGTHLVSRAIPRGRVVGALDKVLGLPSRPMTGGDMHGILGQLAAKVAPGVVLAPEKVLASFALRSQIRRFETDAEGHRVGPASAETIAADLDHLIGRLKRNLTDPATLTRLFGNNREELHAAQANLDFLVAVRHSPKALTRAIRVIRNADEFVKPELQRSTNELVRLNALDPAAAERAPLFPYAITHMDAKYVDGGLRKSDGSHLSNEAIRAHMVAHGYDPNPVHLAHSAFGGEAWHKMASGSRRNADTHHLEGVQAARGSSPADWSHVLDSVAHARTLGTNVHGLDQEIHDVGSIVGKGSWHEAEQLAKSDLVTDRKGKLVLDARGKPIHKWAVVRAYSSRLPHDRQQAIVDAQDAPEATPINHTLLQDRLLPPEDPHAPLTARVVPAEWLRRKNAQLTNRGTMASAQAISSAFRQTVLPFSTKWLTGNVAEAILRTAMVTANPLDPIVARRALDRMIGQDALDVYGHDPAIRAAAERLMGSRRVSGHAWANHRERMALRTQLLDYAPNARAAHAELIGGLFYGNRGLSVRRGINDQYGPVGTSVAHASRLPVVHEFAGMMRWVAAKMFALNRVMEREAQHVAFGKYVRNEVQDFTGHWTSGIGLYGKALDEFSKGLLGTPAQLKAANWLDETLGRYSRFSPNTRKIIQNYAPFLPWYLNAVRFTMLTLPGKHPVKFALLLSAERTFQQDYIEQHKDVPTKFGSLRTSVPSGDGGYKDVSRFTPFGLLGPIAAGGDLSSLSGLLLPEFSGLLQAGKGQDPFGGDLAFPNGKTPGPADLAKVGINQFLESVIPGLNLTRRLREKGGTALATSTALSPQIKPGSAGNHGHGESALDRVFNPLRTTYLRGPASTSRGSSKPLSPIDEGRKILQQAGGVDKATLNEGLKALRGG